MILDEILKLLEAIKPLYQNEGKGDICTVYKFIPLMSDGIKGQSRLEILVNDIKYENALTRLEQIKGLLLTVGAQQKTNNLLEIALNGGGYYFNKDTKTHCFKAIFSIKNKERMI